MALRALTKSRELISKNQHNGLLDFFDAFDGGEIYYGNSKFNLTITKARKKRLEKARRAMELRRTWILDIFKQARYIKVEYFLLLNPKGRALFQSAFDLKFENGHLKINRERAREVLTQMRLLELKDFEKKNLMLARSDVEWIYELASMLSRPEVSYAKVIPYIKVLNKFLKSPLRTPKIKGNGAIPADRVSEVWEALLEIDPRKYWMIQGEEIFG